MAVIVRLVSYLIDCWVLVQVEIKKAEPRDSSKMNDNSGANQWGPPQNASHMAMGGVSNFSTFTRISLIALIISSRYFFLTQQWWSDHVVALFFIEGKLCTVYCWWLPTWKCRKARELYFTEFCKNTPNKC